METPETYTKAMLARDLEERKAAEEREAILERRAADEKALGEAFKQENGRYPTTRELEQMLAEKSRQDAIERARRNEAIAWSQLHQTF